jgi:ferritin
MVDFVIISLIFSYGLHLYHIIKNCDIKVIKEDIENIEKDINNPIKLIEDIEKIEKDITNSIKNE